jgi:hypothetical protein
MRKLFIVALLITATGCSFAAPLEPTPATTPPPAPAGTPATLELSASPGLGDQGGTAAIGVHVMDLYGAHLANITVTLSSPTGLLTPNTIITDGRGRGTAQVTAEPGFVTVQAMTGSGLMRAIAVAIQAAPPPPPAPTPMPGPTPIPEPPLPPLTVKLIATPARAGLVTTFSLMTSAITAATWDFGDGGTTTTTEPAADHIYNVSGTYTANVTVVDPKGRRASGSTTFTIKP